MLFKKSERNRLHPYVTLTIGALTIIGAASVVRCVKGMMRCGCDRVTKMANEIMGRSACESPAE